MERMGLDVTVIDSPWGEGANEEKLAEILKVRTRLGVRRRALATLLAAPMLLVVGSYGDCAVLCRRTLRRRSRLLRLCTMRQPQVQAPATAICETHACGRSGSAAVMRCSQSTQWCLDRVRLCLCRRDERRAAHPTDNG